MIKELMFRTIIILIFLSSTIFSYELEDRLKAIITGKIAKFITWDKQDSKQFTITIFNNQCGDHFKDIYHDKKILNKNVSIKYIRKIENLNNTHILYIGKCDSDTLNHIFQYIKDKNIVTISDIRGFAQKGGLVQIYSNDQKLKLKINLNVANKNHIKIKSSLLRIADVIKGNR